VIDLASSRMNQRKKAEKQGTKDISFLQFFGSYILCIKNKKNTRGVSAMNPCVVSKKNWSTKVSPKYVYCM